MDEIVQRPCAEGNWSSHVNKALGIAIHVAQGSLEGTCAWFNTPSYKRPTRAASSAHYIVGKGGVIVQFVADICQAYHAGLDWTRNTDVGSAQFLKNFRYQNPNSYLLGIELEGWSVPHAGLPAEKITELQYSSLCELVYKLAHEHLIPINRDCIVGHGEIYAPKRGLCPGGYIDLNQLVQDVRKEELKNAGQ